MDDVSLVSVADVAPIPGASLPALATPGGAPSDATQPRHLIHARLGDLELLVDALAVARLALDPLDEMLRAPNMTFIIPLRAMALGVYPILRKMVRAVLPRYPQPELPRGADPVRYLATYLVGVSMQYMIERRWIMDYREDAQTGAIEVTRIRAEVGEATDGRGPADRPVDSSDAGATPRTA